MNALHFHELAHFEQSGKDPCSNTLDERFRMGPGLLDLGIIRGEHRQPLHVVTRVDYQIHGLFDPLGGPFGPEIIEDQKLRLHNRAND